MADDLEARLADAIFPLYGNRRRVKCAGARQAGGAGGSSAGQPCHHALLCPRAWVSLHCTALTPPLCLSHRRHYHASLSAEEREAVQAEWTNGDTPIIVATIAFGMGTLRALTVPACCIADYRFYRTGWGNGGSCLSVSCLPLRASPRPHPHQESTRRTCGLSSTTACPRAWRATCRHAGSREQGKAWLWVPGCGCCLIMPPARPQPPPLPTRPPPHLPHPRCRATAGERAGGARRPALHLHSVLHLRGRRQVAAHDPTVGPGERRA